MTREEAIKYLEQHKYANTCGQISLEESNEAIDMAIEALSYKTDRDLISRQDALKPFCTAPDGTRIPEVDCDNFPVEFSVEFIKKHLLSLPSAEAVQGEWISNNDGSWDCSECGLRVLIYAKGNYCPNCGAKMTERG